MKKFKPSRAVFATAKLCKGSLNSYWIITPYDKKHREIPTSVQCAYNTDYFSPEEAMSMATAL